MLLYHGSNTDIKVIDLALCRPYKDFGRGFYLTVIKEQAEKMAVRVARIYGGLPVLNVYEIDDFFADSKDLNIKNFGIQTSKEWAEFVMNNRNRKFDDFTNPKCNLDNKYDVVIGPIANDDMAVLFRQYDKISDVETGLYRESPAYVYGLLQDEINFGKIIQAEL